MSRRLVTLNVRPHQGERELVTSLQTKHLAASLDAEEALLPFVPYLLQDLWSLGFSPEGALRLLGRNVHEAPRRIADLGCGKGALLIHLAKRFGWHGRGVDIVPEFIAAARRYASEWGVADALDFEVKDMGEELADGRERNLVLFGFDSEALGELPEALARIAECVAPSGLILVDLAWALSGRSVDLPSEAQVLDSANAAGLRLVDREVLDPAWMAAEGSRHLELIRGRATEFAIRYPEHSTAFAAYVAEQEAENRLLTEEAHCGYLLFARN
jgi:SAM-dependent methyltransferase